MVGLLPLTGVPLPFVSHGGTALMAMMASVGILMNISKNRANYHL
jgi:cell division protein FtsW